MRGIGIGLVFVAILYAGFVQFSPLADLVETKTVLLQFEHRRLDQKLKLADREMTLPGGGVEELNEMRGVRMWHGLELARRSLKVGIWMPGVGVTGLGLILLSLFTFVVGGRRRAEGRSESGEFVGVYVWPPRELYSDEFEFDRQHEGGFPSRDEAISALQRDPLKQCEYCGGEMNPTAGGAREGIELVTFYKKVPEGARDLRVVLGTFWFVKAASELKCEGCERVVRR